MKMELKSGIERVMSSYGFKKWYREDNEQL